MPIYCRLIKNIANCHDFIWEFIHNELGLKLAKTLILSTVFISISSGYLTLNQSTVMIGTVRLIQDITCPIPSKSNATAIPTALTMPNNIGTLHICHAVSDIFISNQPWYSIRW